MSSPRVAVITGAAQGVGRAIALNLAQHGYSLALGDINTKQESLKQVADECIELQKSKSTEGPKIYYAPCDVSVESQVEALVEAAVKDLGGIDIMVANAGIYQAAPLLETTDEMFDRLYAVNVKGVLYCYRAAAKAMIPRGGGRIIGASSVAGVTGYPSNGAYGCSKSSVRTLTQTAAREWGRHGITVNAYAPGAVDTNMLHNDVIGSVKEEARGQYKERVMDMTSTGKITPPEDVAGLVAFLVSPAGKNITVNNYNRPGNSYRWWNDYALTSMGKSGAQSVSIMKNGAVNYNYKITLHSNTVKPGQVLYENTTFKGKGFEA